MDKVLQVRIFEENDPVSLEDEVSDFISNLDREDVLDLQYQSNLSTHLRSDNEVVAFREERYSVMITYLEEIQ
ncbi:sporulation protein Cse60 [Hutsoniella sourekii]|uniref:sporulation protein Cse60 n=1 Tax=Hutsoniella sourekii TaxID=87650 RepID=UPI000481C55C|nr:sporulation protein Cse60 [Hutsoniella sourekii]